MGFVIGVIGHANNNLNEIQQVDVDFAGGKSTIIGVIDQPTGVIQQGAE